MPRGNKCRNATERIDGKVEWIDLPSSFEAYRLVRKPAIFQCNVRSERTRSCEIIELRPIRPLTSATFAAWFVVRGSSTGNSPYIRLGSIAVSQKAFDFPAKIAVAAVMIFARRGYLLCNLRTLAAHTKNRDGYNPGIF